MRYFVTAFILLLALFVGFAGFRGDVSKLPPIEVFPDMDRQPKIRPQTESDFFGSGLASQSFVDGTVARGSDYEVSPYTTGLITGTTNFVDIAPVKVDRQLLERGRNRYDIYCSPCHGMAGDGKGVVGNYGLVARNLHEGPIVEQPDGSYFQTISNGKNLMGPYGDRLVVQDRWAVIAYLRALQRSRLGTVEELPENLREKMQAALKP